MKWLTLNVALIAAIAVNLFVMGGIWSTTRSEVTRNADRIKNLEDQKADQTSGRVTQAERRLDAHDTLFLRLGDKLDRISATLERIDQRTSHHQVTYRSARLGQ